MILVDVSYFLNVASSIHNRGDYHCDKEYAKECIRWFFNKLEYFHSVFNSKYGELVLCHDDGTKKYWRHDVYPLYKMNRKRVFSYLKKDENFVSIVRTYWRSCSDYLKSSKYIYFECPRFEADDLISILSKEANGTHVIVSADKDFKQLIEPLRVHQYDPMNGEMITKGDTTREKVLHEHITAGDSCDNIPSIFSYLNPSDRFIKWFKYKYNVELDNSLYANLMINAPLINLEFKGDLVQEYYIIPEEFRTDNFYSKILGEELNIKRLPHSYKIERKLSDSFKKSSSWKKFLCENPLLRYNYERNQKLIDLNLIDRKLALECIDSFKNYRKGDSKSLEYLAREFDIAVSSLK